MSWIVVVTTLLNLWIVDLHAEGNIGCLFSTRVCDGREEWCHNDNAFGQCVQSHIDPSEDLYKYELDREALQVLEENLLQLHQLGYRWTQPYTQCVLQSVLYNIRFHLNHEVNEECKEKLEHQNNEGEEEVTDDDFGEGYMENKDNQDISEEDVAYVSFMPSESDPNAEYANEIYFPPIKDEENEYEPLEDFRLQKSNPEKKSGSSYEIVPMDANSLLIGPFPSIFNTHYNTPDLFRAGKEVKSENGYVLNDNEIPYEPSIEIKTIPYDYSGQEGNLLNQKLLQESVADIDELLDEITPLSDGFERQERLDVKKPGPQFETNNYAFREKDESSHGYLPWHDRGYYRNGKGLNKDSPVYGAARVYQPRESEEVVITGDTPNSTTEYDISDTDYVYIDLLNRFHPWKEATEIIRDIENLLGLPRNTFSGIKPGDNNNQIIFKVGTNRFHWNASQVASEIVNIMDELKQKRNVEITSVGTGNKNKVPFVTNVNMRRDEEFYVIVFTVVGLCAAVVVAAAVLFVVRHHARSREKLQGLVTAETEISKDYQDLCRAHMSAKQQEKPEPIHVGQRIASLSRESEGSNNSPSSRSSTSSWSEEPALANIDISTGHMVLAYMEDHLKNKDRLDQEWLGLCAYEAEPCSSAAAKTPENLKKNRYPDILPYDHSRVVLNDLTNMTGSDYVNASTITDHDPRNPAYIATQGPLPHTAADFWQMVWEQGSVVMVMLTRLTENGTAMCHRYWPEEGSELYHIYEVHLVSEHIWCDDYLVRSFYLKNLKTGETRTVTQFHFLSWAEGGVPQSTKSLLEFRRKVNKSYRGRSCPIVIHCSDGVGRTGTYCLIDMVLNRMAKGAKEIDIAATLEHIRDQRPYMVRTKQQFEFVLTAVADEVNAILKAQPSQQPAVPLPGQ